jgi:hypothetical protein
MDQVVAQALTLYKRLGDVKPVNQKPVNQLEAVNDQLEPVNGRRSRKVAAVGGY